MIPGVFELDRLTIVATLGMRFWDSLSRQFISDGLFVSVYPAGEPWRAVQAEPTRSGVFAVRHVPGLRRIEASAGTSDVWTAVNARVDLVTEVVDGGGRFVPFSMRTSAPQRGPMVWPSGSSLSPLGSPVGATPWVPLFSAATRPVPGGVGVIRAELRDPTLRGGVGGPAAWAVLEAQLPGQPPVRSIADARGRVALVFPYPAPPLPSLAAVNGSPLSPGPGPTAARLTDQSWTLTVRAAYRALGPMARLPDLADMLEQPPAVIWADVLRTRVLTEAQVQFGRETVLRSSDSSGGTRPSVLLVQAGSPL